MINKYEQLLHKMAHEAQMPCFTDIARLLVVILDSKENKTRDEILLLSRIILKLGVKR
jgi:hypothetical protein